MSDYELGQYERIRRDEGNDYEQREAAASGELSAITSFLASKRGQKLLKRVVRTDPGRALVRAIKKEPGGKRALRSLFRDEMPKVKRKPR